MISSELQITKAQVNRAEWERKLETATETEGAEIAR